MVFFIQRIPIPISTSDLVHANPCSLSRFIKVCTGNKWIVSVNMVPFSLLLTFRHRTSCILGQAFHCSPENAFYIFSKQIYFII